MNQSILLCLAAVIAVAAASTPYNYQGAGHYNGHVRYFNDHSGNTVPVMGRDQNNDGVYDGVDSNRDGKVDGHYNYGYHGAYNGHNAYGYGRFGNAYGYAHRAHVY